jgi:hypothetical protein
MTHLNMRKQALLLMHSGVMWVSAVEVADPVELQQSLMSGLANSDEYVDVR